MNYDYNKHRMSNDYIIDMERNHRPYKASGILIDLERIFDVFGHCDEDGEPMWDLEFLSTTGKYYHLYNVKNDNVKFI